jgi:hypothetical protein
VTVPVGVPAPGAAALTVAVNVTACPTSDWFRELVTAMIVSDLSTNSAADAALAVKFRSPP